MPTNQRLRANDLNDLQYRREPAVQLDEKQPVAVSLRQQVIVLQRKCRGRVPRVRSERRHQDGENEPEEPDHLISIADSLSRSTGRGFRYRQLAWGMLLGAGSAALAQEAYGGITG